MAVLAGEDPVEATDEEGGVERLGLERERRHVDSSTVRRGHAGRLTALTSIAAAVIAISE